MKAAILHAPRDLRVGVCPEPVAGAEDVVVRVTLAGLCGTDHRIWSGDRPVSYPRVLGHELVGQVAAVGDRATTARAGERVVVEPNYSCGDCPLCREGNRNLCLRRTAIGIDVDGGFAEWVRVPARCVWPVPSGLPDEDVVLAEPLAVVVRAANRGTPRAGESAAVVGGGTLGLLALQVLRARGLRVLVVSRTRRRLALARELGAAAIHATSDEPPEGVARKFSGREGVDLVVETAGTAEAMEHAIAIARPGGRVVLTGLPHEPSRIEFFSVVRREVTITGSMIYQGEFPEALGLIAKGAVKTRPLLTHRFDLDTIADAFVAHRGPDAIKVTLAV